MRKTFVAAIVVLGTVGPLDVMRSGAFLVVCGRSCGLIVSVETVLMVVTVAAFDYLRTRMPGTGGNFAQGVQSIRAIAPVGVLRRVAFGAFAAVGTFVAGDGGRCGRRERSVAGISRRRCRHGGEVRRGRKGRLDRWKRS